MGEAGTKHATGSWIGRFARAWVLGAALAFAALAFGAAHAAAAPGALDTSFTSEGFNTTDIVAVEPLPDGKAYVAGSFYCYDCLGPDTPGIVRLNPDGTRDTSFAMTGTGLDIDSSATSQRQLVQVNATGGTFTLTFAGQTTAAIAFDANESTITSRLEALSNIAVGEVGVSVQAPSGSAHTIYVSFGGSLVDQGAPALMTASAAGLTGGSQTASVSATGSSRSVNDIAVLPGGDLVAVGTFTSYNGSPRLGIVRLNPDGTLDSSLTSSAGGFSCSDPTASGCYLGSARPEALQPLPDGGFLVGGAFDRFAATDGLNNVMRLNPNGSLDSGFNSGQTGANYSVWAMDLEAGGTTALIGGDFSDYNGASGTARIARLNVATGAASTPGVAQGASFNGRVEAINALSSGKIAVGGGFGSYNGVARQSLAMLSADGTLDTSFTNPGLTPWVNSIAVDQNGQILAGGGFKTSSVPQKGNPLRFLSSGLRDPAYDPGAGAVQSNPTTSDIAVGPDGSVWAVGAFNAYDGLSVEGGVLKVLNLRKVALTKAGNGAGSVSSSPAGLSCSATCTKWFDQASSTTLSATPAAGSKFAGWGGACSGTGSCSLTLDTGKSVTATFIKPPSKPAVKWTSSKRKRTVKAQVTRVTGVTYKFTAKKGKATRTGTCRVNAKTKKLDCTAKLRKGRWLASVTPTASGLTGPAATKTFRFR